MTHARSYNGRNQMTRQTVTGQMDIQYFYSATNNDGRPTGSKDVISGEEVTYLYDELGRLTRAETVGPQWGNSYVFDGFGNLKQKDVTKGVAPTLSLQIDGNTNRIAAGQGFGYDNNGNLTTRPGQTLTYDIDNRLAQVTYSGGSETYSYYANNQRMKKGDTYYFYGAGGEELGTFALITYQGETNPKWIRGRVKVQSIGGAMWINGELQYSDRLGSVVRKGGVTQRYYPDGEDRDTGAAGPKHFATYENDDATGLHYAQQRYYENSVGRFLTADPYQASSGPSDPGSWNRYSYVQSDPINGNDPEGLMSCAVSGSLWTSDTLSLRCTEGKETFSINVTGQVSATHASVYPYILDSVSRQLESAARAYFANQAILAAKRAATFIAERSVWSGECEILLAKLGASTLALSQAARNVSILDGPSSLLPYFETLLSNRMPDQVITSKMTVGDAFASEPAARAMAELNGNRIFIRSQYFNEAESGSILLTIGHELLHNITGLFDTEIQLKLGLEVSDRNTQNISFALWQSCFQ